MAFALGAITGCHRAPYNETAAARNTIIASIDPMPTRTQQPIYLATEYGKPGQPALAPRERALIRTTLAVIKPCQRTLLRYAFPEDAVPDTQLVLFFVEPGKPIFDAHVLWQGNLVYNEGRVVAVPGSISSDIRKDIANTRCSNGKTVPQERYQLPIASPPPLQSPEPTSAAAGAFRVLHRFAGGNDGAMPSGGLILVNGNLYGATRWGGGGGIGDSCRKVGCGAVFESTLAGRQRVLYAFTGPPDGQWPAGGLLAFHNGLYGTTQYGGTDRAGTVFAISLSGRESVIYSFKGGEDGSHPRGDLVAMGGKIYGATENGGTNDGGTVFEIGTNGERVLHSFEPSKDGVAPSGGLLALGGALYGATTREGPLGGGTLFRLTSDGAFSIVHAFNVNTEGIDPGGLTSVNGAMYGTTLTSNVGSHGGLGSIFRLTGGQLKTLYVFSGGASGENPDQSALTYVNGKLYGGTVNGGIDNGGVLFVATTSGRKTVLRYLAHDSDGGSPSSALVLVGRTLCGTLGRGGSKNESQSPGCCGTIFALDLK